MQKLFTKIAPLAAMTACTIWCCWLQLREATPLLAATEASLPRIERKLLHPEICAPCERDPFLQYKPAKPPSQPVEAAVIVPAKPHFNPETVLTAVRLDATILGVTRLAVINGKVHEEGAAIVLDDLPDVRCRLSRVLACEVEVEIEQQTFRVRYAHQVKAEAAAAAEAISGAAPVRETPDAIAADLPAGTPLPEDLDRAVKESLDQLAKSPQEHDLPTAAGPGGHTVDGPEDEACADEQDLLITEKLNEMLNQDE